MIAFAFSGVRLLVRRMQRQQDRQQRAMPGLSKENPRRITKVSAKSQFRYVSGIFKPDREHVVLLARCN